jgi:Escherichia/Staphylococcus phage prohead protease
MNMTIERRAVTELRISQRRLEGYAAKFGVQARIADFVETIRAGAFTASLKSGADVLALVDHDTTKVLARTKSGNLKLAEDATGLAFELSVPETQAGRDVLALADRGDLGGMSFGFMVEKDSWQGNRRELVAIDLREISVVSAWPAYPQTTVTARMRTPRLNLATRYLESCKWD